MPANTLYTWDAPVVTPAGSVTGATAQTTAVDKIGQTLINTTLQTAMVVYKVKPVSGTQVFCEGDVFEVVVYVNPQSGVTDQNTVICSDNIFSVLPTGVAVGTTYTWSNPVSNPVGAVTGGSAQTIPQLAISQSLKNTTNQVATLTYDVEPKTGACADSRFKVVVKVFPKPHVQDLNLEVCSGNELKFAPVHNGTTQLIPANTKYSWGTPVVNPAGSVSGFSGQAIPQESFIQTLTNNTNEPAILTYSLKAISGEEGNCNSNSFKVTVTVNPDAKAIMNIHSNAGCAPFQLSSLNVVNASPEVAGTQFQWFVNNQSIGNTRNFPGYTIQNADDSVLVKLNVISAKGCKNDMLEQLFYTRPVPQSFFTKLVDTVCGPAIISFSNQSPQSSLLTYRWDFGNGQISSIYQPSDVKFMPATSFGDTTYTI
ncbi:MAG: PKD-like domain-containing protein, partial [Bacteroidota bacterium]